MPTTADATGTPARASRDTAVDGEYTARVTAMRASSRISSAAQIRQGRTGASARTAPRGPGPTASTGGAPAAGRGSARAIGASRSSAEPGAGAAGDSDAADVEAIVELVRAARNQAGAAWKSIQINLNVGTFVPKTCTTFQWKGQLELEAAQKRIHLLKRLLPARGYHLKWHDQIGRAHV